MEPRRVVRTRLQRRTVRAVVATALVTAAAMALASCSDDNKIPASSNSPYCKLVLDLEGDASEAYAKVREDPNATAEDYAAADEAFVEKHQDDVDAIEAAAPKEIQDDVATVLAAERAAEVDTASAESAEVQEARERIEAFEEEHCILE